MSNMLPGISQNIGITSIFDILNHVEKIRLDSDSEKTIITISLRESLEKTNRVSKLIIYVYSDNPLEIQNELENILRQFSET